jgi:hypothetical protein
MRRKLADEICVSYVNCEILYVICCASYINCVISYVNRHRVYIKCGTFQEISAVTDRCTIWPLSA